MEMTSGRRLALRTTTRASSWNNSPPCDLRKENPFMPHSTQVFRLYGIKACDTMKKARTWLDQQGLIYDFHDYKSAGIDLAHLEAWCDEHGWQTVLNRAGTTFRKLDDAQKADLDQAKALELMLAQPSMIKRPVLDLGDRTLIAFKADVYAAELATKN